MKETFKLPDRSLLKIKSISTTLRDPDLESVLEQCINVTDMLISKMNRGDSVYIESKKGRTVELTLPADI